MYARMALCPVVNCENAEVLRCLWTVGEITPKILTDLDETLSLSLSLSLWKSFYRLFSVDSSWASKNEESAQRDANTARWL